MFVSIIDLKKIQYVIVLVFYLWYLFVTSAFVRSFRFFIFSIPQSAPPFFLNTIYWCGFTTR